MIKINVILSDNSWKKYLKKPNLFINKKIKLLNKNERLFQKKNFLFSLLLSSTKEIKRLNLKFRKKNRSTDILSFPFYDKLQLKNKLKSKEKIYLGDIIINLKKIKKKKNNREFYLELDKLWIHGLVHLFGYRHKNNYDYQQMKKIENRYLKKIYINDK